jgi:hypothetical protein
MLFCHNPKCGTLYEAKWHVEGKAVKVGRRHYCSKECKVEHEEAMRRGEREEK